MTKIFFIVCQMLQTLKKNTDIFSPNSSHNWGGGGRGGGQDGKWSHFPPFFYPSLKKCIPANNIARVRLVNHNIWCGQRGKFCHNYNYNHNHPPRGSQIYYSWINVRHHEYLQLLHAQLNKSMANLRPCGPCMENSGCCFC